MDEPPANYMTFRAQASQLFNKSFTISEGEFHRAVHKVYTATLALVERGFTAITPAELKLLDDKWMGKILNDPINL